LIGTLIAAVIIPFYRHHPRRRMIQSSLEMTSFTGCSAFAEHDSLQ